MGPFSFSTTSFALLVTNCVMRSARSLVRVDYRISLPAWTSSWMKAYSTSLRYSSELLYEIQIFAFCEYSCLASAKKKVSNSFSYISLFSTPLHSKPLFVFWGYAVLSPWSTKHLIARPMRSVSTTSLLRYFENSLSNSVIKITLIGALWNLLKVSRATIPIVIPLDNYFRKVLLT